MAALSLIIVASCRFRYEELDLLVSPIGGSSSGASPEPSDAGAASDSAGGEGTAGTSAAGGAGAEQAGAGTMGGGGTAAAGSSSGSGGTGGGTSSCAPDATCSCDVFEGHEYRFCNVLAFREAGAAACQAASMGLVRVDSAEENAWLLERFTSLGMFLGLGGPVVFLGGNDIAVEGTWRWDDGTVFWDGGVPVDGLYENWGAVPTTGGFNDCAGMQQDGTWDARACNSGNATVACESP